MIMNRIIRFNQFMGIFILVVLGINTGYSQEREDQFIVNIAAPNDGTNVGRETIVKGTALIPSGHHLWVLARRNDFEPLWWPQREAKIEIPKPGARTGEWKATAVFGGPQDIGWEFDIGVITVNEEGHAILMEYWKKAMKSGDWKPIEIPNVSSPPQILKVKKVRH